MKISVKGDREIELVLPSRLVLNPLSASLLPKLLKEHGVSVSGAQARALFKALNHCRRTHPEWVLVQVQSARGEEVLIRL